MLRIERLNVSYGETLILRDVDLSVGPGQLVCLMGRNGVGKTTLLKSIMGLLRPLSGRVYFEDRDLTRTSPDVRARAGLGYVPQGREIFPHLTVLENLQVGLLANPARIRQVPEQVYEYFPALKTMLDRKGGVLSGGQQQQLAIARVLVAQPKLLILDEPFEGIQPSIVQLIGRVLESLKKEGQVAVLLVVQNFEFAMKLADTYYVMEKGSIVLNGDAAEMDKEVVKPYLAF
jgi:urea transport system ATP-binding protein